MPPIDAASLWGLLRTGNLSERFLSGVGVEVRLADLKVGSSLEVPTDELRGQSILVATHEQLTTALAMIELDGIARRLVLCPTGLPPEHRSAILARAQIDAIVSDRTDVALPRRRITVRPSITPAPAARRADRTTEWILLTSGTTGVPKLVVHDLATLAGPTRADHALGRSAVWSTFYDIRRYGGLQMFFRALLGGGSLVLSSVEEPTADFLTRAGARQVTHISGTPSHWRRALMSPAARQITPRYVRLSGEIADQTILDHLRSIYPEASIAHAFASTEAGVGFEVGDGEAGFPADLVGRKDAPVQIAVMEGSLRLRSARTAHGYLGGGSLADADGFVDTGDMVERRGKRYYFVGRRDGVINVGGQKVHPEEVEAVINTHPAVQMSLVKARPSPITGAIVVADIVPIWSFATGDAAANPEALKSEILSTCRRTLPPHKVPAAIRFVASLEVTASGKLSRDHA